MAVKVELIYDKHCPNVRDTRAQLLRAFSTVGGTPHWKEWEQSSPDAPQYVSRYGSPTVLVNGKDIEDIKIGEPASCCRVYPLKDGKLAGVPPLDKLAAALNREIKSVGKKKRGAATSRSLKGAWIALPGIGAAILPKLTCAACWPAYAGLLSSMGIGFFNYTEHLETVTVVAIVAALASLLYKAKQRWGYKPFLIGILGSAALYLGKLEFESNVLLYSGIAILLGASFWNSWPRKAPSEACGSCN